VTDAKNGNSFTTALNYNRQKVMLEGQLADQSRQGDTVHYIGKLHLAHPNSFTDVQIGQTPFCLLL